MSYRVETASTGRAVCRATECKNNGIKIDKNELRMGTWVEFEERGSWQWRHWGCVTGYQLQNLRNKLVDPENPGVYRWDFLDGYEGDEKNSLDKHPDLQEKVRRVITQGYIDPQDFNGDPEMNKLGEKGLYTAESKKKMRQDKINRAQEIEELQASVAALTAERDDALANNSSTKKVDVKLELAKDELMNAEQKIEAGTKKDDKREPDGSPAKAEKTAKRKRDRRVKKEEEENDDARPVKKSRTKKVKKDEEAATVKEEDDGAMAATVTPKEHDARGKKAVKEESVDDQENDSKSSEVNRKGRTKIANSKKAIKEEVVDEHDGVNETTGHSGVKAKPQSRKGRKKAIKQENPEKALSAVKGKPSELAVSSAESVPTANDEGYIPGIKDSDLQYDFDMALDAGEIEDDFEAYVEKRKIELVESQPRKRGGRRKKAAPKATAPQRSSYTKAK